MKKFSKYIVITTINEKSSGMQEFEKFDDWHLIVVGDKKSVPISGNESLTFLSWEEQLDLNYEYARICPWNHYARKNIGYLHAIKMGAKVIYDTDDDNIPYRQRWREPVFRCDRRAACQSRFTNIYSYFTDELIWPRGLPLDTIHNQDREYEIMDLPVNIGVWQSLADDDPDVDAIYRLVVGKKIRFKEKEPICLPEGSYSPVNSQNTFWLHTVFPLLYLPATVSFRSTDIYRGYIAQRLMWQHEYFLGFLNAIVYQQRNDHDLMADFRDEWECYSKIKMLVKLLDELKLPNDLFTCMRMVYSTMYENNFVSKEELKMIKAWLADLNGILHDGTEVTGEKVPDGN